MSSSDGRLLRVARAVRGTVVVAAWLVLALLLLAPELLLVTYCVLEN